MPVRVVPMAPPEMDTSEVRTGKPVKGNRQWWNMGKNALYIAGKGGSLSGFNPRKSVAPGGVAVYNSYIWPRTENADRLWTVTIGGTQAGAASIFQPANAFGTILDGLTGDQIDWSVGPGKPQTFYLVAHVLSAINPGGIALSISVDSASATNVSILSVTESELPRVTVGATEGPNGSTLRKPHPIYEVPNKSVSAVAEHANTLRNRARRNYLFGWADSVGTGVTITSGPGYTPIFPAGILPPVLARKVRNADDVLECAWAVYASVDAGEAEVRVTAASGDTDTVMVTTVSANWFPGAFDADSEEMARLTIDGGIRGGVRDALTFDARVTTATTLKVYAISVGEGPGGVFEVVADGLANPVVADGVPVVAG